jgi:hypothetical protein
MESSMLVSLPPVTSQGKKRKSAARLQKARAKARRKKKERKLRLPTVVQPPSKAGGGYTLVVKNPGNFRQNFRENGASGDMVLRGTDNAYGHSIYGVRRILPFYFSSVSKEGEDWFSFKDALTLERDTDRALLAGCFTGVVFNELVKGNVQPKCAAFYSFIRDVSKLPPRKEM